eukprot:TRINITY_DN1895_c0_g1_i1.p1 TRINITY_DN1895_c0_g1~~TRINITY_DN1895_c0_g1_i1.p1  ORF type:complete len:391 (+),score=74.75 TRINITY_DN1895_c0_g1_i1:1247-2419(+)
MVESDTPNKSGRLLSPYGPYSTVYTTPFMLWVEKWYPRVISTLVTVLGLALILVASPILIPAAIIGDLINWGKKGRFIYIRILVFFIFYPTIELVGVLGFFLLYVASWVVWPSPERWDAWNQRWAGWWGSRLVFDSIVKVLDLKLEVEMPEGGMGPGPKIMLNRHASFADTLVPQGLFAINHRMSYIVKKDLLWDLALNVGGARTENFFLFREVGSQGLDVELEGMRRLVKGFKSNSTHIVCLWPEGTRYSEKKRASVLKSLQAKDPASYERAIKLNHTLLPRLGAVLALLDANPCGDVVFCSHVGLEPAAEIKEVLQGGLCGQVVKLKFTRVKFQDIPKSKEGRIEWLYQHWQVIDKWVGENQRKVLAGAQKRKDSVLQTKAQSKKKRN